MAILYLTDLRLRWPSPSKGVGSGRSRGGRKMRGLALLSALLTLASPVWAKGHHASISFDSGCGGVDLTIMHGEVVGKMTGCNTNIATGTVGTMKRFGRALTVNTFDNISGRWVVYVL